MATPTVLAPPVRMLATPPPKPDMPHTIPNLWLTPVALVLGVMVPALWVLSWMDSIVPKSVPTWPLPVVQVVLWVGSAQLVYADAKKLNLQRLKLARIKLTASERTTPSDWGLWVLFFWFLGFPWYLAVRRRLWHFALWAEQTGEFANKKELRAALRANRGLGHGQPIPW